MQTNWVITDSGEVLVQSVRDDGSFFLADSDSSWEGGFGAATSWKVVTADDPRITEAVRAELGWLLER